MLPRCRSVLRRYGGADAGGEMTIDFGLAHRRSNPLRQRFNVTENANTPREISAIDTEMQSAPIEQIIDDSLRVEHRMSPG